MYRGIIFLTVADMMELTGTDSYELARKKHKTVRDAISSEKKALTIREFCKLEGFEFGEIWRFLREVPPPEFL